MALSENWAIGSDRTLHPTEHNVIARILNYQRYLDRYASLQSAIDDTPDFGTILIPPGVTSFEAVDIGSKTITLRGLGSFLPLAAAAGNAAWNNNTNLKGSVLKSTATEGVAIDATNGRLHLHDLAIVGANGETTGVKCGIVDNPQRVLLRWSNVQFGNFAVGMAIDNIYEATYDALNFRGCGVGAHLKGANVSVLTGCSVSVAEVGIHLDGSANVLMQGGAIQGVTDTGLLIEASEECTVRNVYFENKDAQYAICTAGISDRLRLENNHTGTANDKVLIGSNHGYIWHGKYGSQDGVSNLVLDGDYNLVYASYNHATIEDNGAGNVINRLGP